MQSAGLSHTAVQAEGGLPLGEDFGSLTPRSCRQHEEIHPHAQDKCGNIKEALGLPIKHVLLASAYFETCSPRLGSALIRLLITWDRLELSYPGVAVLDPAPSFAATASSPLPWLCPLHPLTILCI